MELKCEIDMTITLYHKQTMKELDIDEHIEKVYNEESEEYKSICDEYRSVIGFERESDKKDFDKKLLECLIDDLKRETTNKINSITDVIKKCFLGGYNGCVEFGTYIINPNDFCAINVKRFKTNISKK